MDNAEPQQQKIDKLRSQLSDLESYVADLEDFVTDPVCVVGTSHIITDTNQAFARIIEQSQSDIIGQSLEELFTETDVPKGLLDNPQEVSSVRERILHLKKNNKPAVNVRSQPWRGGAGNLRGFFLSMELKSARKDGSDHSDSNTGDPVPKPDNPEQDSVNQSRADVESLLDEVKEQQMRTQSVIYNIADGLLFVNPDQTIEMVNPSALAMLDVKSGDIIGEKLADLHNNKVLDRLHEMVDDKNEEVEREELTIGAETYFEVTTVHVGKEDGTAQKIIILHDITEKRKIEEMKLEFASVAAHQMRTPLSSIRWSFEILSKKLEDGELQSAVERGYKSTRQVLQVVDELLNVDRLEEGQSGYSFEPVDVIDVLEEAIESERQSQAVIDQPELKFDKPVDDVPKVRGDSTKLRIVFKNLVENALKYTDSDKRVNIHVNMKMTSGYGGDVVLVTVEDSGIGIPESEQDKIFSKFYRANNATDTETEGTGVGLFITKQIVEAHKGKIWFDSEEGEGTTFYVQLPMASDN